MVTRGITPVDKAAVPDGGAPLALNTYVDWESAPERGQAVSYETVSLRKFAPNLPQGSFFELETGSKAG